MTEVLSMLLVAAIARDAAGPAHTWLSGVDGEAAAGDPRQPEGRSAVPRQPVPSPARHVVRAPRRGPLATTDILWVVMNVRIASIAPPFDMDPGTAHAAVRLLTRGAVMGFLPSDADTSRLDADLIDRVFESLAQRGVGRSLVALPRPAGGESLSEALEQALEQSEHSPMPSGEWPSLLETLGEDLLGLLLGISTSSIRRYASGTRTTPQDVADKLHVVALVVADLAGGYNDYGIRRWFHRPRPQLDGVSPVEMLGGGWDPDGEPAERVRELAAALTGAGAS